jgi:hypothetical protein
MFAACTEPFLAITHKYFGSTYLDCLKSLLQHIQQSHLPGALALVEKHRLPLDQNCARILLAARMDTGEREQLLTMAMGNLPAVAEEDRTQLIGLLADYHPEWFERHAGQFSVMAQFLLRSAAQRGRSSVLKCMCDMLPAWIALGERGVEEGFCRGVLDICEAWQWL